MRASDPALAGVFADRLELLGRNAAIAAVRVWRPAGLWISAAGAGIRGSQLLAGSLARRQAELALERARMAADLPRVDAPIGELSSGMVVERSLAAAAVRIQTEPAPARARVAYSAIARIAHTATLDAGRAELHALIAAGPFVGWRWLSRGTCGACLASDDGRDRSDGSAMRVHPGCRCVPEPVLEVPSTIARLLGRRPTGVERFARMAPEEQAAAVGEETAAAIRAGKLSLADLLARDTIHGEAVIVQRALESV